MAGCQEDRLFYAIQGDIDFFVQLVYVVGIAMPTYFINSCHYEESLLANVSRVLTE